MTSGGNKFNDFPEIVPTSEITTKVEKNFLFFRPWPWAYFLNGPDAAATIAPTFIRHCTPRGCLHYSSPTPVQFARCEQVLTLVSSRPVISRYVIITDCPVAATFHRQSLTSSHFSNSLPQHVISALPVANESVPIQLALCWFSGLAIFNTKI